MEKGTLLLASSGKEFAKPTGIFANSSEVKKARKEAMGRLGLDFLDSVGGADDMDFEKELAADGDVDMEVDGEVTVKVEGPVKQDGEMPQVDDEVKPDVKLDDETPPDDAMNVDEDLKPIAQPVPMKVDIPMAGPSHSPTPAVPSPALSNGALPSDDLSGLSARERNRLKRKRKGGNSAFVGAAPPTQGPSSKYSATPAAQPNKFVTRALLHAYLLTWLAGSDSLLLTTAIHHRVERSARSHQSTLVIKSSSIRLREELSHLRRRSNPRRSKSGRDTGSGMALSRCSKSIFSAQTGKSDMVPLWL